MCGLPRRQQATTLLCCHAQYVPAVADYLIDKNIVLRGFRGPAPRLAYLMSRAMPLTVKAKATMRRKASSLMPC